MERYYRLIMRAFEQPGAVRFSPAFAAHGANLARLGACHLARVKERSPSVIAKMEALYSGAALDAYHASRVGVLYAHLATRSPLLCENFASATLNVVGHLHDIGKVEVPPDLLNKQGPLTPQERAAVELHNGAGHAILLGLEGLGFPRLAELQLEHHSYPLRDAPADVALKTAGRLLQLCDQYDALASVRPYRAPLPEKAVKCRLKNSFPELSSIVDLLLIAYPCSRK